MNNNSLGIELMI